MWDAPTGREHQGNEVVVVAAGVATCRGEEESSAQDEGRQATWKLDRGLAGTVMRKSSLTPNRELQVAGEPCAWKACKHGSVEGRWKRAGNSTSPTAYPTQSGSSSNHHQWTERKRRIDYL